ncbi:MAG: primase-helicase family protein [Bacteroidota bacterium]|jgi:hypothetical protein
MKTNNTTHNYERSIELSIGPKDYSGTATDYRPTFIKTSSLEHVFKTYNYTPIVFSNNYRLSDNFIRATGFCVDNDDGIPIAEAKKKLSDLKLNYALITTRSHMPDKHRYRILIPFNRTVHSLSDYSRIVHEIVQKHFPKSDPMVMDGARQLYGSPDNAEYYCCWSGNDYDVDASLPQTTPVRVDNAWTDKLVVKDKDGKDVLAATITSKTVILCPFHSDGNASAFLDFSKQSNNFFINCSACGKTYWKEKVVLPIDQKCKRFYSYNSDICEVGLVGDEFFIHKVGQKKFYVWTGAIEPADKEHNFSYLVREKHIQHLKRIDHVGDMAAEKSYYEYLPTEGIFEVHYAPLAVKKQDNTFINNWLDEMFGVYADFIKQWMAVYCYTNYEKLPTLVLRGVRGAGKNKFAESIMNIFPSISQAWHGEDRNFTPEVQKKLLVADETVGANEKQYRQLKRRSGQAVATVNQKFLPEYQVRNNMNIIILSNEQTPICVEKEELPTDAKNNQFFVYEIPGRTGPLDSKFADKVEERLGYYIRTELKVIYDKVKDYTDCRYSIPTPITETEKALFDLNTTGLDDEAAKFLQKAVENKDEYFEKFFTAGLFPSKFIDSFNIGKGYTKSGVIRKLKELGYLIPRDPVRKMVGDMRTYCFEMTDKFKTWLKEQRA